MQLLDPWERPESYWATFSLWQHFLPYPQLSQRFAWSYRLPDQFSRHVVNDRSRLMPSSFLSSPFDFVGSATHDWTPFAVELREVINASETGANSVPPDKSPSQMRRPFAIRKKAVHILADPEVRLINVCR
jgi:hypothetical protein